MDSVAVMFALIIHDEGKTWLGRLHPKLTGSLGPYAG